MDLQRETQEYPEAHNSTYLLDLAGGSVWSILRSHNGVIQDWRTACIFVYMSMLYEAACSHTFGSRTNISKEHCTWSSRHCSLKITLSQN